MMKKNMNGKTTHQVTTIAINFSVFIGISQSNKLVKSNRRYGFVNGNYSQADNKQDGCPIFAFDDSVV